MQTLTPSETRQYRILSLLGRGGFGSVYRAQLETPEGFTKEVAVKLLSDADPPEDVLTRFRDEARILGLIRDRNIVSVDPPTQLSGRWAVVMEFVDGASCEVLLKRGPFPPTVALEIVEEVARTLDNLQSQLGPDGKPLDLLHRDLKPGNIQITPNGQVKILDFGIARAVFSHRETTTTAHIGGTLGYIAPERLEGEEVTKGDIYSLGVVLHELVTGRRAIKPGRLRAEDVPIELTPLLDKLIDHALQMRAMEPSERPEAFEVEQLCRTLRATARGPDLRTWARTNVPPSVRGQPDDLVGTTLSETLRTTRQLAVLPPSRGGRRQAVLLMVPAILLAALAGSVLGLVALFGVWMTLQEPAESAPVTPAAVEAPTVAPVVAPKTQPPAPAPAPVRARTPRPTQPAPAEATPTPAPAAPAPRQPPRPTGAVSVSGEASSVSLRGGGATHPVPGSVPAGSYEILADFGQGAKPAGTVTVEPGASIALKCVGGFQRCMQR
jgi:eukaryotic-like serine/threonine-protein kinase